MTGQHALARPGLLLLATLASACASGPKVRPTDPKEARALTDNAAVEELIEQGRYQQARERGERLLAELEKILGADHPQTAEAAANLGAARFYLGDTDGARALLQRSLAIRRKAFGDEHPKVAENLGSLASLELAAGKPDEARALYQQALAMQQDLLGVRHPDVGDTLIEMGLLAHRSGDSKQAVSLYRKAIGIWEEALGPEDRKVGLGHLWLGNLFAQTGQLGPALQAYEQAQPVLDKALRPGHPDRLACLQSLARLRAHHGDYAGAATSLQAVLDTQQALHGKDSPELIETINTLASLYSFAGRIDDACPLYQRALSLAERHMGSQHALTARAVANCAGCALAQGHHDQAQKGFERALPMVESALGPESHLAAYCLYGLGQILAQREERKQARALLEGAVRIGEKAYGPQNPTFAQYLAMLANQELLDEDLAAARAHYNRALSITEKAYGPDHPSLSGILSGLGQIARRSGDHATSLRYLTRALDTATKLPDGGKQAADVLVQLADLALQQQDPLKASKLYQKALAAFDQTVGRNDLRVISALHNLAHALTMAGQYQEALEHYDYVIRLYRNTLGPDHPWTGQALCNRALVRTFIGQTKQALPDCRLGLAVIEKAMGNRHYTFALNLRCLMLGQLRLGDHEKARRATSRMLSIAEESIDPLLAATSERERMALVGSRRTFLDFFLSLHTRPADNRNAYDAVLAWKGVVTGSMASQHEAALASRDPELRRKFDELDRIRRRLAEHLLRQPGAQQQVRQKWYREMLDLSRQREALERNLASGSDAITRNRTMLQARAPDVCRGLSGKDVLVDFFVYNRYAPPTGGGISQGNWKRHLLAFVTHSGACLRPVRVELGEIEPIEQALDHFWRLVRARSSRRRRTHQAARIRQLIWDPLAKALKGRRRIWIVPDGALAHLPFGVLVDDDERFLIETHTFGYLSIAQELAGPRRRHGRSTSRPAGRALVVGGIDYGPAGQQQAATEGTERGGDVLPVAALPGTREEATFLAKLLGKRRGHPEAIILSGKEATEERIKRSMEHAELVHLATHGFFAHGQTSDVTMTYELGFSPTDIIAFQVDETLNAAALSGLVLAGANLQRKNRDAADDGLLTAEEVSSLDMRGTRLVTLSACESGSGTTISGEGVLGLRRAFFIAGAQAVVMSLWKVPDLETRRLMEAFYHAMLGPRPPAPAEALRRAKLTLIRDLRQERGEADPLNWGSFIVSGR